MGVVTGSLDVVEARLELGSGVATLTASRVSRRASRTLRVVSEGSYWSVDLQAKTVLRVGWGQQELCGEPVPVSGEDALERELDAFLAFVRPNRAFAIPGSAGLAALQLVDRVRQALARVN